MAKKQKRWNATVIQKFLNIIEEYPSLWDPTDSNYSNRIINLELRRDVARRMSTEGKVETAFQ